MLFQLNVRGLLLPNSLFIKSWFIYLKIKLEFNGAWPDLIWRRDSVWSLFKRIFNIYLIFSIIFLLNLLLRLKPITEISFVFIIIILNHDIQKIYYFFRIEFVNSNSLTESFKYDIRLFSVIFILRQSLFYVNLILLILFCKQKFVLIKVWN